MEIPDQYRNKLYKILIIFLAVLTIHFAVGIFDGPDSRDIGNGQDSHTIILSGHGEVNAVPDIASVYFTISKDATTVKDAQAGVAVIEKKALDFLKSKNVADKDIKTENASFNPKYEYRQAICPRVPMMDGGTSGVATSPYYCPGGKQVIVGYTASESITVKVRNTDDAGSIMQGLGTTGVSDLSGPNFTIDNEDSLKAQARKKAIDDAKMKAEVLAKDLGVRLGKISSFSENSGGFPLMYAKDSMMASGAPSAAPAVIPKGENTISSDVTITWEIR